MASSAAPSADPLAIGTLVLYKSNEFATPQQSKNFIAKTGQYPLGTVRWGVVIGKIDLGYSSFRAQDNIPLFTTRGTTKDTTYPTINVLISDLVDLNYETNYLLNGPGQTDLFFEYNKREGTLEPPSYTFTGQSPVLLHGAVGAAGGAGAGGYKVPAAAAAAAAASGGNYPGNTTMVDGHHAQNPLRPHTTGYRRGGRRSTRNRNRRSNRRSKSSRR